MDPTAPLAGDEPVMTLRERGPRPSFYMPSSDEEDYRESASDGDPPYGADEVDTPMAAPPPPPPAPAPAPAPIVPSLPPTTVDQAAAAIPVNPLPIPAPPAAATPAPAPGPAPALTPASGSGTPTGSVNGGGESGGAFTRRYDELEDIIFSNPKSFVTLANEIATSRGTQLVISDDRTHKVSSAYMHITCSYRKTGCPFILKLTKAKEGGWIIKGAKQGDQNINSVDAKQRSNYRCRHTAGAFPDTSHGLTIPRWLATLALRPEPSSRPGKPKKRADPNTSSAAATAAAAPVSLPRAAVAAPAPPPLHTSGAGGLYSPRDSFVQVESQAGKAPRAPRGRMGAELSTDVDRALAPPFQRSIDLQAQIVPALGKASPGGRSSSVYYQPAQSTYSPSLGIRDASPSYRSPLPNGTSVHYPSQDPYAAASSRYGSAVSSHTPLNASAPPPGVYAPIVATASPAALPEWTAVLNKLGDSSLLPLAKVLASPAVGCTPAEFFAEDEKLQHELLDKLPERATGLWAKLKLAKKIKEGGKKAWEAILEERKKDGEPRYVVGTKKGESEKTILPSQPSLNGTAVYPNQQSLPPPASAAATPAASPSPFAPFKPTSAFAAAQPGSALAHSSTTNGMDVDGPPSSTLLSSSNPPPPLGAAAYKPE